MRRGASNISSPESRRWKRGLFTRIAQSSDDEANLGRLSATAPVLRCSTRYPYNGGHLMVVPYKEVAGPERPDR